MAWWLNEIAQPIAIIGGVAFWVIQQRRTRGEPLPDFEELRSCLCGVSGYEHWHLPNGKTVVESNVA